MIESLGHSWVVDPGDGQVIIQAIKKQSSILDGILITHHHADHIGGIEDLIAWVRENQGHDLRIIGPDKDTIPHKTQTVYDGDLVEIFTGVHLQVLEVPGHTKGHIAYFLPKIGEAHVAALPYEIILQGTKATMLHGKYRIALHWPELTMGTFMKIMSTPGDIEDTLEAICK